MDKKAGSQNNDGVRRLWHGWLAWLSPRESPPPTVTAAYEVRLAYRLTQVAVLMSMIAALVGAGYLYAWLGGYLTHEGLTAITMKTNAALCLTLASIALILLVPAEMASARRWAARICAAVALVVGLLTLVENLSGWDFGIDQLLAVETPGAMGMVSPNRMGTPASLSFTLLGSALLLLSRRDRRGGRPAQALALAVCPIALLGIVGFLYGAERFYGVAQYTAIAWPTAVALLLLGLGLLCARPTEGLMAQVTADDPGGVSLRRLLPAFVLLPLLLGWLRLAGERADVFDTALGTGMLVLLFIVVFSALAYHASRKASRSAQALRESERRYSALFANKINGIAHCRVITDAHGRPVDYWILQINEAYERITGIKKADIEGRRATEVFPGIQNYAFDYIGNYGQIALEGGEIQVEEFFEGTRQYLSIYIYSPLPGEFAAIFTDVTERKRSEKALRESEERFRVALAHSQTIVFTQDADLRYTWHYNPHPGLTDVTVLGRTDAELLPAEDADVLTAIKQDVIRTGIGKRVEVRTTIGGEPFYYDLIVEPTRAADGTIAGIIGSAANITERKQAEDALRESEERLRLALSAADLGVWDLDLTTNVAIHSLGHDQIFGYSDLQPEWTFEIAMRHVLPEDRPAILEAYARAAQTGELAHQSRVLWPDGTIHWIDARGRIHYDNEGHPVRVAGVVADITKRKQAEEALRELNVTLESKVLQRTAQLQHRTKQLQKLTLELSQAEERERRRVAVLLHEGLQQQIAGARFHLNLLKGRGQDDRQRAAVERVDEMLRDAIEQSRSLSRDLSPTVLHMNDLAEALWWLVNRVRTQQGLTVHLDLEGEMVLPSEALATFLFRAAQEMLLNAVKHAGVRDVALRVRRKGHYVALAIVDQGRGFDPQDLQETSGFGLLSIRERVELLGGRLNIKSAKGQGSTFRLVVPDGPAAEDRRQKTEDGKQMTDGTLDLSSVLGPLPSDGILRVLLVDDHAMVRHGLTLVLQESSDIVVVGEAADGREAIHLAHELRPDVVIMDVAMPLMSGDEATRQIKMHLPKTRVIALSMFDEPDKRQKMYGAGAEGYVLKTASAEELLAAVRGQASDS